MDLDLGTDLQVGMEAEVIMGLTLTSRQLVEFMHPVHHLPCSDCPGSRNSSLVYNNPVYINLVYNHSVKEDDLGGDNFIVVLHDHCPTCCNDYHQ